MDLTLASPTCSTCRGSGWDGVADRVCRCVRRADASGIEIDASPDWLRESARDRLETALRRILIDARSPSAYSDAWSLARIVTRGSQPPDPSAEVLARFARVSPENAQRLREEIEKTVAIQTKKKGPR